MFNFLLYHILDQQSCVRISLCGGGDLLKAPGSVAHYLADSIFYSTNDRGPAGGGWTLTTAQVINLIENQGETFYTMDGQKRANIYVNVNPRSGQKFVQTFADRDWRNNLLELEACAIR
jgi:hypothetical protein